MRLIFDLDHTLLDTRALMRDFFTYLAEQGIEREIIEETHRVYRETDPFCYSPKKHLTFIADAVGRSQRESVVEVFCSQSFASYLRPGALPILKRFREKEYDLTLLTRGDAYFQTVKIEKTALTQYFDDVIICQEPKVDFFKKNDPGPVYFINDNLKETLLVVDAMPSVSPILFVRPDASSFYSVETVSIPKITSFEDLDKLLE